MSNQVLTDRASSHLDYLCRVIANRCVGSEGNRTATAWAAEQFRALGFTVETPAFDCLGWSSEPARLTVAGQSYPVEASPFSLTFEGSAELVCFDSVEALETADLRGCIALLHGPLAAEQLFPRNFPFLTHEPHQRIYAALDRAAPAALITASPRGQAGMSGALYPFPMFDDGDFDIPSVFTDEEVGARLATLKGQSAELHIRAARHPAQGVNVQAALGQGEAPVLLTAHIDARPTTPGALDNAAGVTTLLLLAEVLRKDPAAVPVQIVLINGEDYFGNPGEQLLMQQYADRWAEFRLGINLDGLGALGGGTAYSLYECPPALEAQIHAVFGRYPGLCAGPQWIASDHFLFVANGLPGIALTSEDMDGLLARVIHSPADTPDELDPAKLAEASEAIHALIASLSVHRREAFSQS